LISRTSTDMSTVEKLQSTSNALLFHEGRLLLFFPLLQAQFGLNPSRLFEHLPVSCSASLEFPCKTTLRTVGLTLYEWAKCKDKFFSVHKVTKTVDGVEYVMDGVGKVFDKRQMMISRDGKPCMHAIEKTLGIFTGNQWELKIGPGIDPALMVAFMAVMDQMKEAKSYCGPLSPLFFTIA